MYEVVTIREGGKKSHWVVDTEANKRIDSFNDFKLAKKACKKLNKAVERLEKTRGAL